VLLVTMDSYVHVFHYRSLLTVRLQHSAVFRLARHSELNDALKLGIMMRDVASTKLH